MKCDDCTYAYEFSHPNFNANSVQRIKESQLSDPTGAAIVELVRKHTMVVDFKHCPDCGNFNRTDILKDQS